MKRLFTVIMCVAFVGFVFAQDLPKDVEKVYKTAEKLKSKKELNQAVAAYKDVLRSVDHVPSMISIADIEMNMRKPPNYRMAYDYYNSAINSIEAGIASTDKRKQKKYLTGMRDELVPKRKKAQSYVKDFDKAKDLKKGGNRLMDDPDLN